jgi:hypothetical protein
VPGYSCAYNSLISLRPVLSLNTGRPAPQLRIVAFLHASLADQMLGVAIACTSHISMLLQLHVHCWQLASVGRFVELIPVHGCAVYCSIYLQQVNDVRTHR